MNVGRSPVDSISQRVSLHGFPLMGMSFTTKSKRSSTAFEITLFTGIYNMCMKYVHGWRLVIYQNKDQLS